MEFFNSANFTWVVIYLGLFKHETVNSSRKTFKKGMGIMASYMVGQGDQNNSNWA